MGKHPEVPKGIAKLLKVQKGKCPHCGLQFKLEDLMEVHHTDRNRKNNRQDNLALLHRHCHDRVHGSLNDSHQVAEEPDEAKVSRPVLKTSTLSDGCTEFI